MTNRLSSALALVLALTAAAGGRAQVFFTDFESDPNAAGWYVPTAGITTDQAYSGTHSFLVNSANTMYSPFVPYPTGQYVEVDFRAFSPSGSQTAATVSYGNGLGLLQAGKGWMTNSFIFQSTGDRAFFWSPNALTTPPGPGAYIDDLTVRPVTPAQAAQVQDANFATLMPRPFTYTAPADRHNQIPQAAARLAAGRPLNVTMVGDSIVYDTYSTAFGSLVQQRTGATLNVTPKVNNSSGSTYWSQNNRMQDVMATNPDLLLWGGISQFDIPSLRSVIQQARAIKPTIEIVLMSPVAGGFDPFQSPWLARPADPANTGDYRNSLIEVASEFPGVQYWDLTTPWAQYILDSQSSGLTYADWLRDGIHDSGRSELLVGQIMAAYFTPVPEPSALLLVGLAGGGLVAWRRRRR